MDSKTLTLAGLVIGVQIALFAWLKADISDLRRDLTTRVAAVERDVAFVKGQLSLALPAIAATETAPNRPSN